MPSPSLIIVASFREFHELRHVVGATRFDARPKGALPQATERLPQDNRADSRTIDIQIPRADASFPLPLFAVVEILQSAAIRTGRSLRVLYRGYQPADHPVLFAMPETRYLKFYLVQPI